MNIPGVYLANKVYSALVKASPGKPKVKALPTIHVSWKAKPLEWYLV